MAALTLRALGASVQAHGMGGPASAAAGLVELVPRDIHGIMGFRSVARRWRAVLAAHRTLVAWARSARPRAALLVGFTEFHERLGRALRGYGVPVVWCAAPQVWAWRASRLRTMHQCADRLALVLPFEEPLWREAGHIARYVGHPAVDLCAWSESPTRRLAVLCGSREQETTAVAPALLDAAGRWIRAHREWSADVLVAPSLGGRAADRLSLCAREAGLTPVRSPSLPGAAPVLGNYDIALCASGTASLEAALSATPPVVVYRTTPLLRLGARAVLRIPDIALPNVLLGRRAFPEIVDDHLDSRELLEALQAIAAHRSRWIEACRNVRTRMQLGDDRTFGDRVADVVREAMT